MSIARSDLDSSMFGTALAAVPYIYPEELWDEYLQKYINMYQVPTISVDTIIEVMLADKQDFEARKKK